MTRLDAIAPIFPVADVGAAVEHYRGLGFETHAYEGPEAYGFAKRDGVELHLTHEPDVDPLRTASAAYLHVDDADALAAAWSGAAAGGGRTVAPVDTDYGMREGAHVDPWGNLLRFGSELAGG